MAYKDDLVARIKGALKAGLEPKFLARRTGIPVDTIKEWSVEERRGTIAADDLVAQEIDDVLMGRFIGRASET